MTGKLYGVGIGPGDPELLTLKAVRLIKENEYIALPGKIGKNTVAYKIAIQAVPELANKTLLSLDMPMTKDKDLLERSYCEGAEQIEVYLKEGKDVLFLTLGDPTVYATYWYVHKIIEAKGYNTEIISGITSFCAVAARLNQALVERSQMLHVIPSSYQIEEALQLPGTKVLMKAGKKMPEVKRQLEKLDCEVAMIENCGMENEKIYTNVADMNEQASYYSVIIVKEK